MTIVNVFLFVTTAVVFSLFGYLLGRNNKSTEVHRLSTEKTEAALELDSVLVTCLQLETALENVELLHRSKNQFYYSTSHDLRQPLHALSMFCSVLQKQDLDEFSKEVLNEISEAILDVMREIDVLLNIARVDVEIFKLHPVEVNLDDETQRIAQQYQRRANAKGLSLQVSSSASESVCLDRVLFDRILRNLIDNAIKFTDRGHVQVSVAWSGNGLLQLTVSDTGIGISREEQDYLYLEFYQGRELSGNYRTGVGLGLANVLKMVSRLEGTIDVESDTGDGTIVHVKIPDVRSAGKSSQSIESDGVTTPQADADKTVLVLGDNSQGGRSTVMLLESSGWKVLSADNLSQAFALHRQHKIDAACLEPLSHYDELTNLIEVLRMAVPDMPVVVLSSDKEPKKFGLSPDVSVLLKPVSPEALLQRLKCVSWRG